MNTTLWMTFVIVCVSSMVTVTVSNSMMMRIQSCNPPSEFNSFKRKNHDIKIWHLLEDCGLLIADGAQDDDETDSN